MPACSAAPRGAAAPPGSSGCVDPGRSAPSGRCARRRSSARRVRVVCALRSATRSRRGGRRSSARILEALGDGELDDARARRSARRWSRRRLLAPARRLDALGRAELGWRAVERDPLAHRAAAPPLRHELARRSSVPRLDAIARTRARAASSCSRASPPRARRTSTSPRSRTPSRAGGGAIVLVPEVSLVPQIADRLRARRRRRAGRPALRPLGGGAPRRVVAHPARRGAGRGRARGRRSSLRSSRRLIVVDEEHDGGLQVGPHAALRRALGGPATCRAGRRAASCSGRATPDLVTLARVRGGHAERARLVERRVGGVPAIEVVDLRAELAGGQPVDLLVRPGRGARRRCGAGPSRRSCSSIAAEPRRSSCAATAARACAARTATFRSSTTSTGGSLRCHHCGRTSAPAERCPSCGSGRIRYFGAGTQRVEAELRAAFPGAAGRAARLRRPRRAARLRVGLRRLPRGSHRRAGRDAARREGPRPAVGHPGRGGRGRCHAQPARTTAPAERTFQLLAQVAGRAGRGPMPGRVIIQTYAPGHYAVRAAAALDVDGFADDELLRRRLLGYPPFSVLARLLVARSRPRRGPRRAAGEAAAAVAAPGVEVLGPLPAYVARRAGRYRFQVVVRAPGRGGAARSPSNGCPPGMAIDVDPGVTAVIGTMRRAMADPPHPHRRRADPARAHEARLDASTASLHRLLDDMLVTMRDAPGVGLAANQVGVPLQVAVIEIDGTDHRAGEPADREGLGRAARLGGMPLDPGLRRGGRLGPRRSRSRRATGTAASSA